MKRDPITDADLLEAAREVRSILEAGFASLGASLLNVNKQHREDFAEVADAVRTLSDQVEVLRMAIDDVRSDIQWSLHNDRPLRILPTMLEDQTGHSPASETVNSRTPTADRTPPVADATQAETPPFTSRLNAGDTDPNPAPRGRLF
ncbi:MAG: hypothetical protein R3C19_25345 [Planctomycetaceae bacterium]